MEKENLLKITELRHELHMYPELSMQEKETAARIKRFLAEHTHFRIVDRGDWFYAFKEGRNPGAIVYFGNGEDYPPLHTVGYDFNDRILEKAVDLFVAITGKYIKC